MPLNSSIEWMSDLCSEDISMTARNPFTANPFRSGLFVVATDGNSLVAIQDNSRIEEDQRGIKAVRKYIEAALGEQEYKMEPFKRWLQTIQRHCEHCEVDHICKRTDEDDMEISFVFGHTVDRSLLFRFLHNINATHFKFRAETVANGEGAMLIFGGDTWKVVCMGLKRSSVTDKQNEYNSYRGDK